jgi:hypothetical protein
LNFKGKYLINFHDPNSTKSQANQKINFPQIISQKIFRDFSRVFKANTKMTLKKCDRKKIATRITVSMFSVAAIEFMN